MMTQITLLKEIKEKLCCLYDKLVLLTNPPLVAPKFPQSGSIVGDGVVKLTIPQSLQYYIQVVDNDDSATDDFATGGHQKLEFDGGIAGLEIPEDTELIISPRVDGQPHLQVITKEIPVGVTVIYSYLPF